MFLVFCFYMFDTSHTHRHKEPKGGPKTNTNMNNIKSPIHRYTHVKIIYKMSIHKIKMINQMIKDPKVPK